MSKKRRLYRSENEQDEISRQRRMRRRVTFPSVRMRGKRRYGSPWCRYPGSELFFRWRDGVAPWDWYGGTRRYSDPPGRNKLREEPKERGALVHPRSDIADPPSYQRLFHGRARLVISLLVKDRSRRGLTGSLADVGGDMLGGQGAAPAAGHTPPSDTGLPAGSACLDGVISVLQVSLRDGVTHTPAKRVLRGETGAAKRARH